MKKLLSAALSLALMGAMTLPAFATLAEPAPIAPAPGDNPQSDYTLKIDGEDTGVRACVMVPLRAVAEKLDFTVTWNGDGTVFMDDGVMHTTVTIGEDLYQVAMVLGFQALSATLARLKERIADYETQTELATSTDFPAGE